jgi:threonine dehydratase
LKNPDVFFGKRVGIIITGGNVDLDKLPWIAAAEHNTSKTKGFHR